MTDWKFIARKYWRKMRNIGNFPEPLVLSCMMRIRGNVFLDVGSNVGMFALALRRNFGRIYCFEPQPETFMKLQSLKRFENIHPLRLAVSEKDGWVYLSKPAECCPTILEGFRFCPASSPEIDMFVSSKTGEYVKSVSIDRFRSEHGIDSVDLLKIDVEGAEFLVLEGAKRTLEEERVENVIIELHNRNRKEELEKILASNNFSIRWVDPDHILAIHQ